VQVPVGGTGQLVLAFSEGTIATLDLDTGDVRAVADLDLPRPNALFVLADDVWAPTDRQGGPVTRRVSLVDGSVDETGVPGYPVASGPTGLVVRAPPWEPRLTGTFIGADGARVPLALPEQHHPVAVAAGRVLVQVPGSIGTYDPATRALTPLADGELLAVDEAGLARTVCEIGGCVLRAGPWDDLDRYELDGAYGDDLWGVQLAAGATQLVFWRPITDGEQPDLSVVDLATGTETRLEATPSSGGAPLPLTPDGRFAVEARGRYLNFHPLDGGPALQMGQFPETVIAAAVR
jgi:hypothetical protein